MHPGGNWNDWNDSRQACGISVPGLMDSQDLFIQGFFEDFSDGVVWFVPGIHLGCPGLRFNFPK